MINIHLFNKYRSSVTWTDKRQLLLTAVSKKRYVDVISDGNKPQCVADQS